MLIIFRNHKVFTSIMIVVIFFSYLVRPVLAQEIATSSSPSEATSTAESPQLTVEEPTPDTPPSGSDRATYYIDKYYEKNVNGSRKNYYYLGNIPIGFEDIQTGAIEYTLPDHLGSKSIVTDSQGAIKKVTDYYPYGQSSYEQGTDPIGTNHQFTGKEFDPETSLQYFGARYYDSIIGKFTAIDPLSLELTGDKFKDKQKLWTFLSDPQRLNAYSYANDNPVVNYDPDGNVSTRAVLLNPIGTAKQAIFWQVAAKQFLDKNNYRASSELLQYSLTLNPRPMEVNQNNRYSYLIDQIKQSNEYKDFINGYIHEAEQKGSSKVSLSPNIGTSLQFEHGDLHLALNKVSFSSLEGSKDPNGIWNFSVSIFDKYNFEPNNKFDKSHVTDANNLAVISQSFEVISPYEVHINFNDKRK